ncbi:unnamed protein product [Candidula unifasciata]|uniref:MD-2-related lipid-recognition domain-containing protein n=1 Tax=Candidula unifasciata TaxID=100452 RepID=A0A8S3Z271_9EUPU|nr:unnamed protein product [Candidula unifasciata]
MNRKRNGRVVSLMAMSVALMSWVVHGNDLVFKSEVDHLRNMEEDIGSATKCDTTKVNISWTPRQLSPSGQVEITFSYTAPHDMNGGFMNLSLYFHGEQEPFVGYSNKFSCDDIKPYSIKCPLRKKLTFSFTKNITNLHPLTSFPGDYDAIVDIKNEKNESMLCLNFTLSIKEI